MTDKWKEYDPAPLEEDDRKFLRYEKDKSPEKERRERRLNWYHALIDNWKALGIGLGAAVFVGGQEFIKNVLALLTGGVL